MTRTVPLMGTLVTIQVVRGDPSGSGAAATAERVDRAFGWFRDVEACCNRFDPASEARRLSARVGQPVPVSEILFEAVRFSLAVAEATGGAFDPTLGYQMEARGFNRDYRTGQIVGSPRAENAAGTFRDVALDAERRTITILRPLMLDLGGVAKGLAIDLAARELRDLTDFAIDAGGDLYLGGRGPGKKPWSVGIRHPRQDRAFLDAIEVADAAVCTSGDYERRRPGPDEGHHLLDPRTGMQAAAAISATVMAPTAMAADALATAAFVLGPEDGLRLLERQGVEGVLVSSALARYATRGIFSAHRSAAILPDAERSSDPRPDVARGARRRRRRHPADCAGAQ